ncbi:MAG: phosphate signaling complex protein PhoU [Vicinamibacterales bacterium]|jgi:phosphate transport system protein|nr:phosphate signaling complex protein PhoU [Vicinamibacterales bacterium]
MPLDPTATLHVQDHIAALKARLLAMGGLAEERLAAATRGLVDRDVPTLDRVVGGDDPINQLQMEVDSRAFQILALLQPKATDLRTVVAAVKIATDLERVGDLAVNIAEAARRYLQHAPVKDLVDLPRMAVLAERMLRDALDAYVRSDAGLAQQVLASDDSLDALRSQVFRDLLACMAETPATIEPSLDLLLVSRHLERVGDHATNVAEDVIFIVSARDVRHHAGLPPPSAP